MRPQRIPRNALNAGELSPRLAGRSDIDKYHSGLKTGLNIHCYREGGFRKRAGFIKAGDAKASVVRMEGFNLKLSQDDIEADGVHLEFSAGYIRFWNRDGSQILDTGVPLEVTTPYDATEIFELDFAQKNNLIVITHPSFAPRALRNYEDGSWTFEVIDWRSRPYTPLNDTEITLQINANGDLEASAALFDADWVGSFVRLQYPVANPNNISSFLAVHQPHVFDDDYTSANQINEFNDLSDYDEDPGGSNPTRTWHDTPATNFNKLYRCIADYTAADSTGSTDPADYPSFFEQGIIAIGPLSVSGQWEFETKGDWQGTWHIERSFDDGATWELVATVQSDNDNNEEVTGQQTATTPALFRVLGWETFDPYPASVYFRIIDGVTIDEVEITAYTNSTTVEITAESGALTEQTTGDWSDDAFSERNGYPAATTFHEGRLWFGGTPADPERIYASRTDDFYNFSEGTLADDSFNKPVNSNRFGAIVWLVSQTNLLIGTTSAEWTSYAREGGLLTPEDSNFHVITHHGSDPLPSLVLSDAAVFVQKQGRKIREFSPAPAGLGVYASPDLTELAEHITRGGIKQLARRSSPETELFALRNDGVLCSLLFERSQNLYSWHRWTTEGTILSVSTTTGEGEDGAVFLAVERTVGGSTDTYIEYLSPDSIRSEDEGTLAEFVYLDHAILFDFTGSPSLTLTVGTDYNDQEFTVTGDGLDLGEFTVSAGDITLPATVTNAVVGLSYTAEAELMPPEIGGHGNKLSSNSAHIRVRNSFSIKLGNSRRETWNTEVFSATTPTDTAKVVTIPGHTEQGSSLVIRQERPYPLTVQTIDLETNAGQS